MISSVTFLIAMSLSDAREDESGKVAEVFVKVAMPAVMVLMILLLTGLVYFFVFAVAVAKVRFPTYTLHTDSVHNNYLLLMGFMLLPIMIWGLAALIISKQVPWKPKKKDDTEKDEVPAKVYVDDNAAGAAPTNGTSEKVAPGEAM